MKRLFSIILILSSLMLCSCTADTAVNFNSKSIDNGYNNYLAGGNMAYKDNDRYIFYSVHDYELSFYRKTVESERNGIWKYDPLSGKEEKISDECIVADLLATENYLYCYKVNTILLYGMHDEFNLGYKIIQIPIQ